MANVLNQNDDLVIIKILTSLDGRFKLSMQADGNLALYGPEWDTIWASGTYGKTVSSAIMQADGNFVLYAPGSIPIWSSNTWGNPGASLCVQNDGNVIINDVAGKLLWSIPPIYIDTKNLVTKLIALKAANPNKKVAFVFSGGGARAAWFGGILEAFEQEVRRQQPNTPSNQRFAPDMLVGTSGGALSAIGYFADLMNSGQSGPYANRQSWLWREISRNNEAATLLLENPGVLEIISGARAGKSQIDWTAIDSIVDKPLSYVLPIASIPSIASPTFMTVKLFKTVKELKSGTTKHKTELNALMTSANKLQVDCGQILSRISSQNLTAPWVNTINSLKINIANIKNQIAQVKSDVDFIIDCLNDKPPKIKLAFDRAKSLISEGGQLIVSALNAMSSAHNDLLSIPVGQISAQLSDVSTLFKDIKLMLDALLNLLKATHPISEAANAINDLSKSISEILDFLKAVLAMANANSSLMNTTGLKNAFHELLRLATPLKFIANGSASKMDEGIFKHWQAQRTAKLTNPLVRAPELILTAGNITANRLALLTLCDADSAQKLAGLKRWVIGLDLESSGFLRGRKITRSASFNSSNPNIPENWIFGAWPNDYTPPISANIELNALNATEVARNNSPISITPKTRAGAAIPADCPFEQIPGISLISGTSIIAGAALTTAAIPIAFPPRLWRFENQFLKKLYFHWFVDGGICDNRPIEHAIDAGADYIVSFELTPLRKAIKDIPVAGSRPNIVGMISASLIDTPIDSAFKRFIESYVANHPPEPNKSPQKKIWRIAPDAAAGEEDETIGVYDFNGYWNKGDMKMGLFDWFMRGYLDGVKSLSSTVTTIDPVLDAYSAMTDYGQKINATHEKSTPGYFEVDFYNNKPHPGYI